MRSSEGLSKRFGDIGASGAFLNVQEADVRVIGPDGAGKSHS